MTFPIAPAIATPIRSNLPVETKYPEKGMIISEGKGIKADSMAIVKIIPGYPRVEIVCIIQAAIVSTMLYIVATPIGNLKDITLRALDTLKSVDGIICEDTRRTSLLLNNYQIKKPLYILNDYNEAKIYPKYISMLQQGQNMALVSDAGTPLISDPGYKLIRECLEQNIPVDSIPGPSSILTALTLSGLPPAKFLFLGYPPEKSGPRIKLFQALTLIQSSIRVTYIFFVSPYKLTKTLEDMEQIFGDIEVVLAHELTKIHQSITKQSISQWTAQFKKQPPKGEYILLFSLAS